METVTFKASKKKAKVIKLLLKALDISFLSDCGKRVKKSKLKKQSEKTQHE